MRPWPFERHAGQADSGQSRMAATHLKMADPPQRHLSQVRTRSEQGPRSDCRSGRHKIDRCLNFATPVRSLQLELCEALYFEGVSTSVDEFLKCAR